MSIVYTHVKLYTSLRVKIGTENGSPVYKEYTEESYHRPLIGSGSSNSITQYLGTPLYDIVGVAPRKGREFSEMEVGISYPVLMGLTDKKIPRVIWLTSTTADGLIGWIDGFEPVATKGPSENTRIRWHIDWWLTAMVYTYQKKLSPGLNRDAVSFGMGRIKRGPEAMARPDPSSPRMWNHESALWDLIDNDNGRTAPVVIVCYTESGGEQLYNQNEIKVAFWYADDQPLPIPGTQYYGSVPDLGELYTGQLPSRMGIDADDIKGVWISPVPPVSVRQGAFTINFHLLDAQAHAYKAWREVPGNYAPFAYGQTLSEAEMTNDRRRLVVADPMGNIVSTLAWGVDFKYISYMVDVSPSAAYLYIKLMSSSTDGNLVGEGRIIQIPLIQVPVTSNAWSSYNYSGQRDYDVETAKLQREQAALSGILGAGGSIAGGAIAGSMAAPGPGTVAGAAAGASSAVFGTATGYFLGQYYDKKAQEAVDKLTANQSSSLIMPGMGKIWYYILNRRWSIIRMVRDPLSLGELDTEHAEIGYITDTLVVDAGPFIAGGGPMRIEDLEIKGDIPKEGRNQIAAMFARGVHLDLIG